jgi:regulatory protein
MIGRPPRERAAKGARSATSERAPKADRPPRPERAARTPRTIDAGWIEWAASEHLARYSSTRANLKKLLQGRVRRGVAKGAPVAEGIAAIIDAVLDKHVELGTLNDTAWAETKARSLTRRGVSSSMVKQRLRQKGVTDGTAAMETVAEEMRGPANVDGEEADPVATDLVAACAYARRKRIGPFARDTGEEEAPEPTDRKELRAARDAARAAENKVLASMARSGFSFGIAKQVLAMDRDEADELLLKLR